MAIAYGLIEPVELHLPRLPRALEGLRIAHISDLHTRRVGRLHQRLATQLTSQRLDLVALTGDYMNRIGRGEEPRAADALQRLLERLRPRLGIFGVFGNHDTDLLRQQCAERSAELPVRWLNNQSVRIDDRPIELMGLDMLKYEKPDAIALTIDRAALDARQPPPALAHDEQPLRLMLTHMPGSFPVAADLGADLMICGHTHGGQCRLPTGHPLINATDLPLSLTSGVLRHRNTLVAISRGIGFVGYVPRLFCKPHIPVYTLRRGTMPGVYTDAIENLRPW